MSNNTVWADYGVTDSEVCARLDQILPILRNAIKAIGHASLAQAAFDEAMFQVDVLPTRTLAFKRKYARKVIL